jgi:hypothetical protein
MSQKTIDITPHTSLLPKLGFSGYTTPQALAELVDNSIDATMDDTLLRVAIHISKERILVIDNAQGMDETGLTRAMTLAYSTKKGKLGEFGLGLKTACLSLGGGFQVQSKQAGADHEYSITFDEKDWLSSSKGWRIPIHETPAGANDHYTNVTVTGLKCFYPNLPNYIRHDFEERFAPFILAGRVRITVNKVRCAPSEPELLEGTRREFTIHLGVGRVVTGWYALLKQGSMKGHYGFTTYRRGRMITAYDKIGIGEHPTLARIVGAIHLDYLTVATTKTGFNKDRSDYREVEEALREEFRGIVRLARQKAGEEKVTKDVATKLEAWKDNIADAINSDEFRNYTARVLGPVAVRDSNGTSTGTVEVEKRSSPEHPSEPQAEPVSTKSRTPTATHPQRRRVVRIKGKSVKFEHNFAGLGAEASWRTCNFDETKGIEIFTNTDFPAFHATTDQTFYAVMSIAESIAEVLVQQAEEDSANIDEVRELILRKAALLKLELD